MALPNDPRRLERLLKIVRTQPEVLQPGLKEGIVRLYRGEWLYNRKGAFKRPGFPSPLQEKQSGLWYTPSSAYAMRYTGNPVLLEKAKARMLYVDIPISQIEKYATSYPLEYVISQEMVASAKVLPVNIKELRHKYHTTGSGLIPVDDVVRSDLEAQIQKYRAKVQQARASRRTPLARSVSTIPSRRPRAPEPFERFNAAAKLNRSLPTEENLDPHISEFRNLRSIKPPAAPPAPSTGPIVRPASSKLTEEAAESFSKYFTRRNVKIGAGAGLLLAGVGFMLHRRSKHYDTAEQRNHQYRYWDVPNTVNQGARSIYSLGGIA